MSILPVHQMVQTPNFLATGIAAKQAGQQDRARSQALADQQQLRGLAPNILAGDPGAYQQAAAIDPEAAGAYQEAGDAQLRRLEGFVKFIDDARASGDVNRLNGALQSAGPYLAPMLGGRAPPTQWAPEMDAGWDALKARIAGAKASRAGAMPTGFREFEMTAAAAGLKPGTPEYERAARVALGTEGRAASGGFGFETVKGADGRDRVQRRNPRTGTVEIYDEVSGDFLPIGGAADVPGPAPSAPAAAAPSAGGTMGASGFDDLLSTVPGLRVTSGARSADQNKRAGGVTNSYHLTGQALDIGRPSPEQDQLVRAWATRNGYEVIDGYADGHLHLEPAPQVAQAGGGRARALAVGRSPEEQAAATTAATQAVELANLPARQQIETQGAVDREVGVSRAKTAAESARELPKIQQSAQQMRSVIRQLLDHPGLESATGLGSINPLNRVPGTEGYNVRVLSDQLQGQTFLQAFESLKGGGPITDVEGQKATDAIARLNRGQSTAEYRKALGELLGIVDAVESRAQRAAARGTGATGLSPPQTAPVQRARNPQTGEVLELRNGQWVPAR